MRRLFAMVLGALLVAAAPAPPTSSGTAQSIVGTWYEEVTYGGSPVISIWIINADGTFRSVYRRCMPSGQHLDSIGSGRWTYAFGHVRTVEDGDGTINEYETESNDGRVWIYRGVAGAGFTRYGAVRFKDIKVGPDSKLPTCDVSS